MQLVNRIQFKSVTVQLKKNEQNLTLSFYASITKNKKLEKKIKFEISKK